MPRPIQKRLRQVGKDLKKEEEIKNIYNRRDRFYAWRFVLANRLKTNHFMRD